MSLARACARTRTASGSARDRRAPARAAARPALARPRGEEQSTTARAHGKAPWICERAALARTPPRAPGRVRGLPRRERLRPRRRRVATPPAPENPSVRAPRPPSPDGGRWPARRRPRVGETGARSLGVRDRSPVRSPACSAAARTASTRPWCASTYARQTLLAPALMPAQPKSSCVLSLRAARTLQFPDQHSSSVRLSRMLASDDSSPSSSAARSASSR